MTGTSGNVSERVAERLQVMTGEVAEIVADIRPDSELKAQLHAVFEVQRLIVQGFSELSITLAAEIDRLGHQTRQ